MKTFLKIIIAIIAGLAVAWLSMTVLNLDQVIATVITVIMTSGVYGCLDKVMKTESGSI